jgi:CRISPR/Cas system CMR-associated protein Cmr5 small subunit
MKTLAQIRAANALAWKDRDFGGKNEGNVVSGFPMIIKSAGLLAALAYAVERKEQRDDRGSATLIPKNKGEFAVAIATLHHLIETRVLIASEAVAQLTNAVAQLRPTGRIGEQFFDPADGFLRELSGAADASQLRRATAEALAFLGYLKRFVA